MLRVTRTTVSGRALLPGLLQSNQRAELLAVVLTCLRDPRPLDICSDSEYVCKGVASSKSWTQCGWQHGHADLWNCLAHELCGRDSHVCVSWVKGHATRVDVLRGRSTEEDKRGNDGADELARAGARLHHVSAEVVASAKERRRAAVNVQRMMLCILKARFLAETLSPDEAEKADRGSDHGDDMSVCGAAPDTEPAPDNEDCMSNSLDDEFDWVTTC